jgi:hypothetical protein
MINTIDFPVFIGEVDKAVSTAFTPIRVKPKVYNAKQEC